MNYIFENCPHVIIRSNIILTSIPSREHNLTQYYNGDSVIYVKQGFFSVLPNTAKLMEKTAKSGTLTNKCSVPGMKQMATEQLTVQNVKHFRFGLDQLSSKVMMTLRVNKK